MRSVDAIDPARPQFGPTAPNAADHWEVACPACRGDLKVHQPDERLPERLLATCPSCSPWYVIEAVAAVMISLPDEDALPDT